MVGDPISKANAAQLQAIKALQQMVLVEDILQVESTDPLNVDTSPFALYQRFLPLQEIRAARKTEQKDNAEEVKIKSVEEIEESATRFQNNNEELKAKTLLILRSSITDEDSPEEILNKVLRVYPDHSLADQALDFLIETTTGKVQQSVLNAKEQLNQNFAREIKAGRNISVQSQEFAKEGLGSPTSLRDMYRDITLNPREPLVLFDQLAEKFPYDKLRPALLFLLHSLGADLRSKGPSIAPAELKRLIDETRSLQGILGVYRFFQSRIPLMQRQFASYDLLFPPRLNFEIMARGLVKVLGERYMNAEKLLQFARIMGFSEEAIAHMIILTHYRDALKQIAPRYFRSPMHKDELTKALLQALDKLEEETEEDEEQPRKKKEEKQDE